MAQMTKKKAEKLLRKFEEAYYQEEQRRLQLIDGWNERMFGMGQVSGSDGTFVLTFKSRLTATEMESVIAALEQDSNVFIPF